MSRTNGKKEIIEKIQKWLEEEGYQSSIIQDPYADFQVNLQNPNMSIILYRNKADCVTFAKYVSFNEEDKKAFSTYKDKEKKLEMLSDLQRTLIGINVEYSLSPNVDNLERVEIIKRVYFDALTKDKFVDTIFALRRATAAVELMYHQLRGRYFSNESANLTI